jgi:hypothetical protein
MNNKKLVSDTKLNTRCPKCSSIVSHDSFEPTCVMCGWVDYSQAKSTKKLKRSNFKFRKLNKAS